MAAAAAAAQNLVHFTMTVSESTEVAMEGTGARVIFPLTHASHLMPECSGGCLKFSVVSCAMSRCLVCELICDSLV